MRKVLITLLFLGFLTHVKSNIKLPSIINNHMVLQQNAKLKLWGWADAGEKITVSIGFLTKPKTVIAKNDGQWEITIKTKNAGGPYTISFYGKDTIIIDDVLLGEVWLCSGQSNMKMPIDSIEPNYTGIPNASEVIAKANYSNIRFFQIPQITSAYVRDDCEGSWSVCSSKTAGLYSAIGYFFAKEINTKLEVPVGIISSTWGGTPIHPWMSEEAIKKFDKYNSQLENLRSGKKKILREQNAPTFIYNKMIYPLINYHIKGILWYQGESNIQRPVKYGDLFVEMIKDWRTAWNLGNIPFYFVEIAPYDYTVRPYFKAETNVMGFLRESQAKALELPNTAMIPTIDIGDLNDIHPKEKEALSIRIAHTTLHNVYKQKFEYNEFPSYKKMKIEGSSIRIYFKNVPSGLMCQDTTLKYFEIAGKDKNFIPAHAVIEGKTILVSNEKIEIPVAVRFAFHITDVPNLFTLEGLPVSSFRTDNW